MRFIQRSFVFFALATLPAHAEITLNLTIYHNNAVPFGSSYFAFPTLDTSGAEVPVTFHSIQSPGGAMKSNHTSSNNFGTTSSAFATLEQMMDEITNGVWSLVINSNDVTQADYTFEVSAAGFGTNDLPQLSIVNPTNGAAVFDEPSYAWEGLSGFDELRVTRRRTNYTETFSQLIDPTNTMWVPFIAATNGAWLFEPRYEVTNIAAFSVSIPEDAGLNGLSNWSAVVSGVTYTSHEYFFVPIDPLTDAMDNLGLEWTTGGEADWFRQTVETYDSVDAAQSGAIGDDSESWIETTVVGPGYLEFYWKISSDDSDGYDYLEVRVNGNYEDEIAGEWDWEQGSVYLEEGSNTVRWTYIKDEGFSGGDDAAWLDDVTFIPEIYAEFYVTILQRKKGTGLTYSVNLNLDNVIPEAVTTHEVESPAGLFWADEDGYSTTELSTLQDVLDELTNDVWSFYYNRGDSTEREYTFSFVVDSLDSNDYPIVCVTSPVHTATGVSSNPLFAWTGPTNFNFLFVSVSAAGGSLFTNVSISPLAVSWTNAPSLPEDTNTFVVSYSLTDYYSIYLNSQPEDNLGYTADYWSTTVDLVTEGCSVFIVGGDILPQEVDLVELENLGAALRFSILSESGYTHTVECRTNMLSGVWEGITNFPGDGNVLEVTIPFNVQPGNDAYYRVVTE